MWNTEVVCSLWHPSYPTLVCDTTPGCIPIAFQHSGASALGHQAVLSYAQFHKSNLTAASFQGAVLHRASFVGATCVRADFRKASG